MKLKESYLILIFNLVQKEVYSKEVFQLIPRKLLKELYEDLKIEYTVNNYDEFRGLVLHEKVKEPYNKILEKYNTIINNSIYKNED